MNSNTSTSHKFIDSHCHFDFDEFEPDRTQVWNECQRLGVSAIIIPGVNMPQWQKIAELANSYRGIYFAAGLHPWWVEDKNSSENDQLEKKLVDMCKQPNCVALGEIGLDKIKGAPIELQTDVFEYQLQIANRLRKPVILHCRKAHNEMLEILDRHPPVAGGVLHGYSGSLQQAQAYWRRGIYIGVGGTISYDRATKTRAAVKSLPLDAIVLETDAPDMPLVGQQGKRNSPENIPLIAQALAQLKSITVQEVSEATVRNTMKLFELK